MNVKVIEKTHQEWEREEFPTFPAGTAVTVGKEEPGFRYWPAAQILGRATFVPLSFVEGGKLTRDYNPTELAADAGDILEVLEIVNAWLFVRDARGDTGWIPAENVISIP